MPGAIQVVIRDGRAGRKGGRSGVTPDGQGEILETRDVAELLRFKVGDRLTLSDGTEVVVMLVRVDLHSGIPYRQTVHVGDVS
jgi:hypothetical protein